MKNDDLIHNAAFWHNCSGPEEFGKGAFFLPRFPEHIRNELDFVARPRAMDSCGVELRFATEAPIVHLTLSAHAEPGEVLVWRGDFHCQRIQLPASTPVTLRLETPPRMKILSNSAPVRKRYSPELWRIEFGRGTAIFHSIESFGVPIRPPRADEVPSCRWLAHGSSITHANPNGYTAQTARKLGIDVLNKGLAGSCHANIAAAKYFVEKERWNFATVELGVNMRDSFEPEEFQKRAYAFLDLLRNSQPHAPLFVITHFMNAQHFSADPNTPSAVRQKAFDNILRKWVSEQSSEKIRLIEGTKLLDDFTLLSSDLIHPTLEGHTRMAENLTPIIAALHQEIENFVKTPHSK